MIAFVLAAGAMVLAACLLLLWPLLGRGARGLQATDLAAVRLRHDELSRQSAQGALDAEGFARARDDLARRLLDQVMTAGAARPRLSLGTTVATVLFVTLASAGLYWKVGTPQAMDPLVAQGDDGPHGADGQRVQAQIRQLEEKLAAAPDDADGWVMLGRSYTVLNDYAKATQAYAKAVRLKPREPQLLVDFADVLAMAQGRRLDGEPVRLIEAALAIDPANVKGLLLAGTAAFEKQDFKRAADLWQRVLPLAGDDRQLVEMVERNVAEARGKAGASDAQATAATSAADSPAKTAEVAPGPGVGGRVSLAARLAGRASPEDTVFIFARPADGGRMPLAVLRMKVRDLPRDFVLDDTQAMSPASRLSGAGQVVITARVTKSGDPAPKPGDLQGQTGPVKVGARGIRLEIAEVVESAAAAVAPGDAARSAPSAAPGASVGGRVSLAPALAAKAGPDDTVFIFARTAEGPKMPLAVVRVKVRDLPRDFTLDDSLAMAPTLKISGVSDVLITARVSKSGDPAPRAGDLQGQAGPVKVGSRDVRLEIAEIVK